MHLPRLIEPEALVEHLDNPRLLVIDLSAAEHFAQGHVPGSINLNFRELIVGTLPAPGKIPPEAKLISLLQQLGITQDSWVVALDDEGGGWAGRLMWTLDLFGFTRTSYLNGGLVAWRNEGFTCSTKGHESVPSSFQGSINPNKLVEAKELISSFNSDNPIQILDARSPAEFSGEKQLSLRAGHMPKAINVEWTELMDHQRNLRIRTDAQTYLQQKGITLDQPIVTHCQSHHRSGFTWLVGTLLELDIRAYHGSWSEWGNREDTQVEL
ncbi:rhodanese-like domain-containing protein [uncultured Umboniibacter sp.]|uniref:sulfurtransferase n=1 Tax=uncultured Umboniibacter sp. TaxID=1798917 RepID=UPI00261BB700|nr:rhodanese-like domain-containing protein [uncultured Umboniibacter sp.]